MSMVIERLTSALAGRYRIDGEVGQGGMATVYLAQDLKHDRKVAIKVLRAELAAVIGADRFLTEIKTTANLQHPHILALHDSGEADSFLYYVMPFIEGESLRDRLSREKQLPVNDAVRIAGEVASALDYAHRHGVIHRDIKPENILLHDGRALVADFGIALAASKAGGARMTETGMSLGTPHYMSPEQAMGEREITARSDIYALGAMTYEMLLGEPPFTGPTAQNIVAKVVTEEPRPMLPQRKSIPPAVEAAVLTALEKLPADRFGTAAEFAAALLGQGSAPSRQVVSAAGAGGETRWRWIAGVLSVLLLAVGTIAMLAFRRPAPDNRTSWLSINLPMILRVAPQADPALALSPDGRTLAYTSEGSAGTKLIVTRRIGDPLPTAVGGTENGSGASFSNDGAWLVFLDPTLRPKKVAVSGGSAVAIPVPPGVTLAQIRWAANDDYAVTLFNGQLAILRTSGRVDTLLPMDTTRNEVLHDVMQVLPNGDVLAIATTSFPLGTVMVVDPGSRRRFDIPGVTDASWVGYANGHLVWSLADGSLFAAPYDLGSREPRGRATPLNARAQTTRGFRPKLALSAEGALAYVPIQLPTLVQVTRSGLARQLLGVPRNYHNPRVSPDGRRLSLDFSDQVRDVWLYDFRDTTLTRLTFESDGHDGFWSPDGRRMYYASAKRGGIGILSRASDGGGGADSVLYAGKQISVHGITPDGRTAVVVSLDGFVFDIATVALNESERRIVPVLSTPYNELFPSLSPDGRWLAYVSDESNRNEVYVRPFPGPGSKVLVSQGGGTEPIWSRDGRELFYRGSVTGGLRLIAARVETADEFRVLSRTALFEDADYEGATPHANYDVMPDGQSFIMVRQGRFTEVSYVANWPTLLTRAEASGQ
jgi:Tol biopolymer transport system component/tRNA A-37 threonylcarbamoyl transferase component Bud32